MNQANELFHYRLSQPASSVLPGAHAGKLLGAGQLFKRHEALLASPDPRRIDLRASLLDPFQQYRVRVFQQPSKLSVYVVVDLSASMRHQLAHISQFVWSAAQSAVQLGDDFGFIGCGETLHPHWILPARSALRPVQELLVRLQGLQALTHAESLTHVNSLLPNKRSLLFLVSDGHFSLQRLPAILQPLARHAVVPMIWWHSAEINHLPEWGLVRLQDAENRRSRTLLLRPALKQRIIQAYEQRKTLLRQGFRAFGMEPLFLTDAYQAADVNRYFQQHSL